MFLELHGKAVLSLTQPFSMIGDPPSWKRVRMHAAAITEQDYYFHFYWGFKAMDTSTYREGPHFAKVQT